MQLELAAPAPPLARGARRVLALCFPDLSLQRALRAREAARCGRAAAAPFAVERDGRIAACSPEARERGIHPGDAIAQARAACAELEVAAVDAAADAGELEALAEALLALAPAVELAPPDALLLDASAAHLLAPAAEGERTLAARALAVVAGLGLHGRAAVASGRGPALALARHGGGADPVSPGDAAAAAALAPLPLAAVADPALAARLGAVGLRSVHDLARLPGESLAHRFGPGALAAWRLARGEDRSPLVPFAPRALPREALDLEAPAEALDPLLFALKRLCDRAAARLAGRGLGATRLALALRLDGAGEERVEIALARPTSAAARWLLVVRERLAAVRLAAPVRGVVLAVAEASPAAREQLALGDRAEQLAALDAVLARLAARLGDGALFAAAPVERHRPERAYRAAPFSGRADGREGRGGGTPRPRRAARRGAAAEAATLAAPPAGAPAEAPPEPGRDAASPPSAELVRPTRLLPRPEPLVALGEGGRLTAVRFAGRALAILDVSPAERLCGEWWMEPFEREYHRARLEGLGDCWIYRDASDGRLWLHGFFD